MAKFEMNYFISREKSWDSPPSQKRIVGVLFATERIFILSTTSGNLAIEKMYQEDPPPYP